MDLSKKKQQTCSHVSFGSVFEKKRIYLLREAPYSKTQMAVPNNIDVLLPSICSLCFMPEKMVA